jgi:hypothetical protein
MNIFFWLTGAIISNVVARVLLALGVSFVSYVGLDALLNAAYSQIKDLFFLLEPKALNLFGLAGIDTAMNYIFSAYVARLTISSLVRWRVSYD